jgi:predicted amidohydrolase YtcJ
MARGRIDGLARNLRGMPADVVFRVGRAYGMTADRGVYQAVAVCGGRIAGAGRSRDDLDSLIGPGTAVIDDPELVLYPAFADTHNHQLLAARDLDYVALDQAHSIDELVQALRDAAARTPAGEWNISSRCWHETHLREGRLPTARELDAASADHPIFVQRGGHVAVANSAALRMAGITATSADPPSGTVVRLADGTPAGALIEAGALDPVRRLLPPVTQSQQAGLLARQCQLYNRSGIGVVRDPGLVPDEVPVYQAVADRGELTTRTRLMFWVLPQATVADTLAYVDSLPPPGSVPDYGGGLGIWGLVTRGTRTVGVQGPESRVETYTAIWLYTAAGGRLLREDDRVGILAPGAFADIVGFRGDLMDDPVDDLPSRQPALTLVGGRPVHDPDGLFG